MSETTKNRRRAYELWTDERNAELVELVRAGVPADQVAARTNRSVSAIQLQAMKMIPTQWRVTKSSAISGLAMLLEDPRFDWREPLRELQRRARGIYWDTAMNDRLRYGWEQARALDDLCDDLGASEIEVARQLMRLALAENMSQVAQRLGCDPVGTLAGRLRVAADRAGAAVWVLIVDNAIAGGSRTDFGGAGPRTRHVSVHADYDTADLVMAEVLLDHVASNGDIDDVTATIAERTIGDGGFGLSLFQPGADALPRGIDDGEPPRPALSTVVDLDAVDDPGPALAVQAAVAAAPRPQPGRRWWSRHRN